jgi:hypothetical protein
LLGPFGTIAEQDFDKTVSVNLKGTFFSVQSLTELAKTPFALR